MIPSTKNRTDALSDDSRNTYLRAQANLLSPSAQLGNLGRMPRVAGTPIVASPALLDQVDQRLLKLTKRLNEKKLSSNDKDNIVDERYIDSLKQPDKAEETKEPWQQHRQLLSMVFAIWFVLAIGLLINTIYSM